MGALVGVGRWGGGSRTFNLGPALHADPPILRQFPPDFRDRVRRLVPCFPPLPRACPPGGGDGGSGVGPNPSGQAVCASLHPQEAMQMVPKFCFPFDVERYGRKQTPKDPETQTPGTQTLRNSDIRHHIPRDTGAQGPRDSDT